jgi:hypothetical protein
LRLSFRIRELLDLDRGLALAAHVDERHLGADGDDRPFDRLALVEPSRLERSLEEAREIVVLFGHVALLTAGAVHCMLRPPSSVDGRPP